MITKSTQSINIAHFIYETIALQVPLKKLHPDEEEGDDASDEYVYVDDAGDTEDESEQEQEIDPRWAALQKLNKGNKN